MAAVRGPDEARVGWCGRGGGAAPAAMNRLQFAWREVVGVRAGWAGRSGATPGMRGSFQDAGLPGVSLTFSPSDEPLAGTQGRSLDHIGFEVDNLEAFCEKLEAAGITFDRPYTVIDSIGLAIAFFTDPFGTYIELTEGRDGV